MNPGHYAVIGKGSVAAAAGWLLQAGGLPFCFIGRAGPEPWTYAFEADGKTTTVSATPPGDLSLITTVLVCVKAYDLADACSHLPLFSARVHVLPFANGATEDVLAASAQMYPRHLFRTGFATLGVSRLGPAEFSLRSRGGTFLFGPLSGSDEPRTDCESRLVETDPPYHDGPVFQWSDDIRTQQRRKWLFNTVINTLTAARGLARNGDLLSDLPMLASVFSEAFSLAESLWGPWGEPKKDLYEKMLRLIQDTGNNENSMAADVRLGRRTESDFLAGLSAQDPARYPLLQGLHAEIIRRRAG